MWYRKRIDNELDAIRKLIRTSIFKQASQIADLEEEVDRLRAQNRVLDERLVKILGNVYAKTR